jgi:hydroxymethylbilane synthase
LAAYAQVQNQALALQALVATPDGRHIIRAQRVGALEQACTLGEEVARAMLADGAQRILQALKNES